MSVVLIVLNAPRLERVDKRHEHKSSNNIFHKFIFAERAMPAVMADHEELQERAMLGTRVNSESQAKKAKEARLPL